ncbi:hypothetical protein K8942_01640 [Candidatus Peribacteria bacterium]|nr:MAG: hypothetical protein K8942_01640 [Candidatus Peribacteria bacterium]
MEVPYSSKYTTDGLFAANIIHFLYALHMIPAVQQSVQHKLSGAITLQTSQGEQITTYLHELPILDKDKMDLIGKKLYQLSAQILLGDCYEIALSRAKDSNSEIMDFFRHIRNACAHNGRFLITKNINRLAKWRDKEIDKKLDGTPLFDFFAVGDALLFLRDVEQHLLSDESAWQLEKAEN